MLTNLGNPGFDIQGNFQFKKRSNATFHHSYIGLQMTASHSVGFTSPTAGQTFMQEHLGTRTS